MKKILDRFLYPLKVLFNKWIIVILLFVISLVLIFFRGIFLNIGVFILGIILSPLLASFFHKTGYFNGIKNRDQKIEQLEKDKKELLNKIKSLEGDEIIIKNITPILEMSILKIDFEIIKYFDYFLKRDKKDREIKITDNEKGAQFHFIGAFSSEFTAKYGIDLRTIEYKLYEEERTIYVSSFEPKMNGISGFPNDKWLGDYVLEKSPNILEKSLNQWVVKKNSKSLNEIKGLFKKLFEDNRGEKVKKLEFLRDPLKKQAFEIIKLILGKTDWQVKEVKDLKGEEVKYLINRND